MSSHPSALNSLSTGNPATIADIIVDSAIKSRTLNVILMGNLKANGETPLVEVSVIQISTACRHTF